MNTPIFLQNEANYSNHKTYVTFSTIQKILLIKIHQQNESVVFSSLVDTQIVKFRTRAMVRFFFRRVTAIEYGS